MNSALYEELVRELVSRFSDHTSLRGGDIGGGRANRITGGSSYRHQIDVSVRTSRVLLLIECKFWSRPISTAGVLTLASRLSDIRTSEPTFTVHASLVSTRPVSAGARALAQHFGLHLDRVTSADEYVLRIADRVFASLGDTIGVTDELIAVVTRG